jgi:methionyl-tRNA formyltransferase
MKILFITQNDPFYVRLFFEEFFKIYDRLDEIAAVVIGATMGKKSNVQLARQMYFFYGPMNFFRVGLKYAVYKVLAKIPVFLIPRGGYSVEQLCKHYGIPVIQEGNVHSREFLTTIAGMDLDLIISVAAPVIFKEALIRVPRKGCINIHNGKLPRYRGMLPNFWQMYHDEKTMGITIHEINPKIDDGKIIVQEDVAIKPKETLDSLIRRTKKIGAYLMIKAINMIKSGNVEYRENSVSDASYFSFPTREDVREFKRRGKRIM